MSYNQREYYRANRQRFVDAAARWNKANPEKVAKIMWRAHIRRRYGSSEQEYLYLLELQRGCCAMCGRSDNPGKRYFDIDHDHFTGRVRGLLCTGCNYMVGRFEHLPDVGIEQNDKIREKVEKYLTGRVLLAII